MKEEELFSSAPINDIGAVTIKGKKTGIRYPSFSGKQDINDNPIFDGHIVESTDYPFTSDGELNYRGIVFYSSEDCAFFLDLVAISNRVSGRAVGSMLCDYDNLEIVGNTEDNKELLKKGLK